MATLHVRNVPDDLYEMLRARAESEGDSISSTVVTLLSKAFLPQRASSLLTRRRRPRHVAPFERFTDRARGAIVIAQKEARELGHAYLGTEHLLLGLFGDGVAARALAALGVSAEHVREKVVEHVGRGDAEGSGSVPLTPRAKRVLELALREALARDQNHVGTEHILLGITCEGEGVAAQILRAAGVDDNAARLAVATALRGTGRAGGEVPGEPAFRVVELTGSSGEWQDALNAAARDGWELISIHADAGGGRAIFHAS
jgi:Clp amino terminal domain, pathogenicity island component